MPASAISRSRSASSNAATTRGSKPRNADRNASRLRRIVDHDRPGLEGLEREPLEQLDVVVDRRAPLVVVVRDHQRVGVRPRHARPPAPGPLVDHRRYGTGFVSNSVLRSIGSPAGRAAFSTDRNTAPDTVFVPSLPMSVTLDEPARDARARSGRARSGRRRRCAGRRRTRPRGARGCSAASATSRTGTRRRTRTRRGDGPSSRAGS